MCSLVHIRPLALRTVLNMLVQLSRSGHKLKQKRNEYHPARISAYWTATSNTCLKLLTAHKCILDHSKPKVHKSIHHQPAQQHKNLGNLDVHQHVITRLKLGYRGTHAYLHHHAVLQRTSVRAADFLAVLLLLQVPCLLYPPIPTKRRIGQHFFSIPIHR